MAKFQLKQDLKALLVAKRKDFKISLMINGASENDACAARVFRLTHITVGILPESQLCYKLPHRPLQTSCSLLIGLAPGCRYMCLFPTFQ